MASRDSAPITVASAPLEGAVALEATSSATEQPPAIAEDFTRATLDAKEMAENPSESYAELKARAAKAEEKLKELQMMSGAGEASSRWRRRRWDADSAAAAGVNAIPEMPSSSSGVTSSSLLSNALASGGGGTGGSELASAAVQSAPLTIQLLIPLLMLLVLFGFISLFAYALDFRGRRGGPPGGGVAGRQGHRRMPSGDTQDSESKSLSDWSPRRGFSYNTSWNTKLNEAPTSSATLSLPPSFMAPQYEVQYTQELEQRRASPARNTEERRSNAVGLHVV